MMRNNMKDTNNKYSFEDLRVALGLVCFEIYP
jgi:hypothetical protein